MNGVNYAEALVKARRYEIATESAQVEDTVVEEDTTLVAESLKDAIKFAPQRIKSGAKQGAGKVAGAVGQKIADKEVAKAVDSFKATSKGIKDAQKIVDGGAEAKKAAFDAVKNAKKVAGDSNAVKDLGKEALKGMGKKAAIGAGIVGGAAAAAVAAKKIADKKKAAKAAEQEVKENFEYEEYETLVENVINVFMSEEEIMSENANEIAVATADYFIEHIDEM